MDLKKIRHVPPVDRLRYCQLSSTKVDTRSISQLVDNTCDSRKLVYHTDRPPVSTARFRRTGSSATADTCYLVL